VPFTCDPESLFPNFFHSHSLSAHSGPSQNISVPYTGFLPSYDPSFSQYFNGLDEFEPQAILSNDGTSTRPSGSDEIPLLREPVIPDQLAPVNEPFRLDRILHQREQLEQPLIPLLPVGQLFPIPTHQSSRSQVRHPKLSTLQFHPYTGASHSKLRGFIASTQVGLSLFVAQIVNY
jgi:hypothetical protein